MQTAQLKWKKQSTSWIDKAVISFMTQRLTIETENDMDEVLDQCQKAIDKVEDDCRIVR